MPPKAHRRFDPRPGDPRPDPTPPQLRPMSRGCHNPCRRGPRPGGHAAGPTASESAAWPPPRPGTGWCRRRWPRSPLPSGGARRRRRPGGAWLQACQVDGSRAHLVPRRLTGTLVCPRPPATSRARLARRTVGAAGPAAGARRSPTARPAQGRRQEWCAAEPGRGVQRGWRGNSAMPLCASPSGCGRPVGKWARLRHGSNGGRPMTSSNGLRALRCRSRGGTPTGGGAGGRRRSRARACRRARCRSRPG
jgi:hypothetical protein